MKTTDYLSTAVAAALSIEVQPAPLVVTTTGLPGVVVGSAYSAMLAASGGVTPYAWSVSSGTLPAGLSLDSSTGVIDGTPTTAGTYEFSVQVTDDWAATASKALSIEVLPVDLPIEMDPSWLEITRFRMGLPPSSGRDSFVLEGRFNLWPNANAPETVRLNIDNWSLVVDAASWKRAGNSSVYTCRQGGVTCKMTYWVLGTSKCLLQFTGIRQTLRASLTNPNIVPVRLRIGTGFDQTVVANMQGENPVKLSSLRPPLFCTQSLMIRRKLNRVARDRFAYKGKLLLEQPFSPAADSLTMRIGPYAISIPAGTMAPPKKGIVKYTARTVHGRMTLRLNRKTGAFTVNAKGVDMSAVTLDTELSLSITNHPGADWTYKLLLARNKAGTLYGY